MSKFCPVYPQPKKSKLARWKMFFSAQQSWLDGLYERSYQMHMGEVQLPGSKLYMVNQPDLVRKVLVDDVANYPKHSMLGKALEPLLGQSIFTTNGMLWKRQRSMMNPAFEQARMTVAFPRMREAALAMLERMAKASKHAPYDVDAEMTLVTADIIFRTIFTLPITSASAHKVFAAFAAYQNLTPKISLPTLYGLGWLVPFWTRRKSQRVAQEIREELAALIRPRFEAARQQADDSSSAGEDILGALLAAKDEHTGEGFEFEELLDQVAMLFLAGHETSASALSWALHLISHSPEIQERMHAEVLSVSGSDMPQASELRDFELTRNVFREALRLYPPVGFFAREAAQADQMRDKQIAPNAAMVIAPWLIHRHRTLWHQPDVFDPDRHDTAAGKESARCAYLPFGMGPRVCIGAAFAQQEASLILAALVQRYRFRAVPGFIPQPVGRLTIRSANGMLLHIEKRPL